MVCWGGSKIPSCIKWKFAQILKSWFQIMLNEKIIKLICMAIDTDSFITYL
jgi:hypothetical protein